MLNILRKTYPVLQFIIALILEIAFLLFFGIQGLHLLLGAFANYQEPLAGFLMYLLRMLSLLTGMIFLEEVMRHALTKERYNRFLPILYFGYAVVLGFIFCIICPEIFALSQDWLLWLIPILSTLGMIMAILQYFYVKKSGDQYDTEDIEDDDDFAEDELV